MSGIEAEVVVGRPRQEVFDFVSWGENLPRWNESFKSVQPLTGGAPTQGSQYQVSMDPGGDSTFEYYEFVPGDRVCFHGSPIQMGPRTVNPRGQFYFEDAEGGGTRVRYVLDPQPVGGGKGTPPMMKRKIRKDVEKDLGRLKQVLEGR